MIVLGNGGAVRRRYVARPETRTVTGGRMNSVIATDEFLERNAGVSKPVCLQSCDECFLCGGALVMVACSAMDGCQTVSPCAFTAKGLPSRLQKLSEVSGQ